MSKSIRKRERVQSAQPGPNEICCFSEHDKGQLTLCASRVHVCVRAFVHGPPVCVTCVSGGTSLEEQVRRIKDIEAIESDSFVPQAFKSSRDDIKVRSVSPFSACPSLAPSFHSVSYWISPLQYCAVCPETAQTKSNIPIQRRLFQPETVSSDAPLFAASKAAAPTQKPQQATAISLSLFLSLTPSLCVCVCPPPPPGCADADKTQKSLLKCCCCL